MEKWISRSVLLVLSSLGLAFLSARAEPAKNSMFTISRENVLGTSLDISLFTDSKHKVALFEQAFMKELDRLSKVFKRYDPDSELSRLNRTEVGVYAPVSKELYYLIRRCRSLQLKSAGAFNPFCGKLLELWRQAQKDSQLPAPAKLEALTIRYGDGELGFLGRRRKSNGRQTYFIKKKYEDIFDLDAMAKGRILDRGLRVALETAACEGALVNIGGDLKCYGNENDKGNGWAVSVADPSNPADNASPLTRLRICNLAVATSAGYARSRMIGGKSYSHIVDPRTGQPACGVLSATVVAPTAAEADGLATALCVLDPEQGLALADSWPAAACLIVDSNGTLHPSGTWRMIELTEPGNAASPTNRRWPPGQGVKIQFTLSKKAGGKYHRHFVAAWVSDSSGKAVRMLALWFKAKEKSYLKSLNNFWKFAYVFSNAYGDLNHFRSVSKATRPLGKYSLYWDGKDDQGQAVPPGLYTIHIDINRENGPHHETHACASADLNCGTSAPHSVKPGDVGELTQMTFTYGPVREKKRDRKREEK